LSSLQYTKNEPARLVITHFAESKPRFNRAADKMWRLCALTA
jgi:hypothetical protein